MPPEAIAAVAAAAAGYCNLEYELETGDRGRRTAAIEDLLRTLTGAPAATAVNNNAGATVLTLRALARGREVIVSRGQLVEIGGSFRLPEIFEVSGARLREVGTTNKTRISDYAAAIGPDTAAIMRVHPSNFRIVGFTEAVEIADLATLAHAHGLYAIDDIGSGSLCQGFPPRVTDEPTVAEGIAAGADVVLFSGDKLLGGPQCGIMVGDAGAIGRIQTDPLMRALRLDKMTLAALEATLRLLLDHDQARARIPLWKMIEEPVERLERRANALAARLRDEVGLRVRLEPAESYIGGGSTPDRAIPTVSIVVSGPFPSQDDSAGGWAQALRRGEPAVVPRVHKGAVVFDLRTVPPEQDDVLLDAIRAVCHHRSTGAASSGVPGPVELVDNDGKRPSCERDERHRG
jgi:L-seryl-tRNA(Ser) seleniumtransferase